MDISLHSFQTNTPPLTQTIRHPLRLGFLLGATDIEPSTMMESSRFIVSPLSFPSIPSQYNFGQQPFGHLRVTAALGRSAQHWHQVVSTRHPERLDIAMSRILSATSSRWDPRDAFIDISIALENMFGSRNDTTASIAGGVAGLLAAEDDESYQALAGKVTDLYNDRSRLVHGSLEPTLREALESRRQALAFALSCLRQLYEIHPELLDVKPSTRSRKLSRKA